jgi:hypothetical protein
MASYRVVVAGLAAVFTVGMTSLASAGGWGWGGPGWGSGWGGPGGFGGWGGCGHCGAPSAAVVYAQPVAPLPPPPPPIVGPGCGCHSVVFAAPPIAPVPIAPAPIYVVNQGPEFSGPGVTVPFHTWRPTPGYGPGPHWRGYGWGHRYGYAVHGWQYGAHVGYGYGYHHGARPWGYGAHFAYHRPFGGYPYHRSPLWGRGYPWNK